MPAPLRLRHALILPVLALAACADFPQHQYERPGGTLMRDVEAPETATAVDAADAAEAAPLTVSAPPLSSARRGGNPLSRPAAARPEAFDRTTAEQRAAASAPVATGARSLGTTVASLGNPTEQGFWIKTPLVSAPAKGRLLHPASGKTVNVDLIPLPGPASGGSQVSLPALQMLGVSLTDLPRLEVFAL